MGRNQHKPNRMSRIPVDVELTTAYDIAPIHDIAPHIHKYWKMRKNDKDIVRLLMIHRIDTSKYGLG